MTDNKMPPAIHASESGVWFQNQMDETTLFINAELLKVEDREITYNDVIQWAYGIMGAIGTENAKKVTDQELSLAIAINNARIKE